MTPVALTTGRSSAVTHARRRAPVRRRSRRRARRRSRTLRPARAAVDGVPCALGEERVRQPVERARSPDRQPEARRRRVTHAHQRTVCQPAVERPTGRLRGCDASRGSDRDARARRARARGVHAAPEPSIRVRGGRVRVPGRRRRRGRPEAPLLDLVAGVAPTLADARLGGPGGLGFWVAAIRESFEEAGVLLARDAASSALVRVDAPASSRPGGRPRRRCLAGDSLLRRDRRRPRTRARRRRLLPSPGTGSRRQARRAATTPGSSWPPRPSGHAYHHDDDETVDSDWIRPLDALERARREEIELIYPTFRSLQALAQFDTAEEVLCAVDAAWDDHDDAASDCDATDVRRMALDARLRRWRRCAGCDASLGPHRPARRRGA